MNSELYKKMVRPLPMAVIFLLLMFCLFQYLFAVKVEDIEYGFSDRYEELMNKQYLTEEERAEFEKEYQEGLERIEKLRRLKE